MSRFAAEGTTTRPETPPQVRRESVRIGILTPSSNTVLEPLAQAILGGLPQVTAHFSRFRVTSAAATLDADRQFAVDPMLEAARLLADAQVTAISWSGTSAAWLGVERDKELCDAIYQQTGTHATSAILALRDVLQVTEARSIGLVTPYTDELQDKIIANFERQGIRCAAERHLGLTDNFSFSRVSEASLRTMLAATAATPSDAICILCTNMQGAPLVKELEGEFGIPIYDSVELSIWGALRRAGISPHSVKGRGRLFNLT